ncbi:MAG: MotA/TolQ/ExbB proton channel family protein [Lentisphaerae bacterium]|nr:MotA/TolQ/ExbB proton channel family protein [Lentisphaerota bacterium]
MKTIMKLTLVLALVFAAACACPVQAQEAEAAAGDIVAADGGDAPPAVTNEGSGGFFSIIMASGPLGVLLWLFLFGAAGAGVYFAVDCAITVRAKRIMPQALIDSVTESMAEGDVLKALQNCEQEPGPLANILSAGFSHVEEGYDVIQESISTAADLETEQLMQKLTWMSVVGNLAPMLGLLGTVQGMIAAFSTLGQGAPDVGVLAENISQALFTTAGGLMIAVPCVAGYYIFRNSANRIMLEMEAMTIELIKDLRNVEVVDE